MNQKRKRNFTNAVHFERKEEAEYLLDTLFSTYENIIRRCIDMMLSESNDLAALDMYRQFLDREADVIVDVACWLSEEKCDYYSHKVNSFRDTLLPSIQAWIKSHK